MIRLRIGIGGESPLLPCHTTGHAGPHPAVRRIELKPYDQGRESKRVEVGSWWRKVQSWRVRESRRAVRTAGGLRRQVFAHTPLAEFFESRPSPFPLLPHHRPKSRVYCSGMAVIMEIQYTGDRV